MVFTATRVREGEKEPGQDFRVPLRERLPNSVNYYTMILKVIHPRYGNNPAVYNCVDYNEKYRLYVSHMTYVFSLHLISCSSSSSSSSSGSGSFCCWEPEDLEAVQ
jgi:hypothetical protein